LSQIAKFTQPDQSGNPRYFIEFLDMVERFPKMSQLRTMSFHPMRVQEGARILDVGCGIGTTTTWMADRIPGGSACGVDISEAMVAEATARAKGRSDLEFKQGEACNLPFPDSSFDAVRMERVLLYVPDRGKAVAEMMRVTKPGGRVTVIDTDVDCTAIHSKNRALTRKMTSLVADTFPHPTSGRELPSLLRSAGLEDVTVEHMVLESPYEFCMFTTRGTLQAAAEAGKVTHGEVEEWYQGLAELHAEGDFQQLWFFAIASGTVPQKV
jgi:ubiquinone/menaquinone biosynthesis C-methylase UbiE